jgi:phosphoribosyl-ATP pyrophosphohydrolase
MLKTLEELISIIRERKVSVSNLSYTKKLINNKSLRTEKLQEEISELIEAAENNSNKVHEASDVIYHLMVYLEANNIKIEDVMEELKKRKRSEK